MPPLFARPSVRQAGFTLLEILLVAAVAALLVLGGIASWRMMGDSRKVADTTRLLVMVADKMRTYKAEKRDVAALAFASDAAGADGLLVKDGLLRPGQKNAFGGGIRVAPRDGGQSFEIALDAVPAASCAALLRASAEGAEAIAVNGAQPSRDFPVSAEQAKAACARAANRIAWRLR